MNKRWSRMLLPGSYAVLLLLLVGVTVLGITRLDTITGRLHGALYGQDAKTTVINAMLRVARDRSQILYALFTVRAESERQQLLARYGALQSEFDAAGQRLHAMQLSDDETRHVERVMATALAARGVRESIVERLSAGDLAQAGDLLLQQGLTAEDRFHEALFGLLEASRSANVQMISNANAATREALLIIAAVGLLFLAGAARIAVLATRHVERTENALQLEKELAQVTLHSIGDGVVTTDEQGGVEYLNPVAERYTGWTVADAKGQPLESVFQIVDERTGAVLQAGSTHEQSGMPRDDDAVSVRLVDRSGRECPIRYSEAPIRSRDGRELGRIVVFHDISQIRAMAQQLIWQASHDALTGLVNRREFERRLAELVETARVQQRDHALLFLDLDNFKAVNDTCGHSAGDELLRQLTGLLVGRMRGSDTLARLGGDEFGALLESCPLDQALRIANALRETVREYRFVWEAKTFSVGVSIGLVPIDANSGNINRVLAHADACCYEAKKKGRDRVEVYRPDQDDGRHSDLRIITQINHAFEHGSFRLYRQKIVPLRGDQEVPPHYEVLVRMVDAAGELIPPTGFMPAAERYNLLTSIERWVISSLVEHLHYEWSAGRIPHERHLRGYYSVNMSGASVNDRSFPEFLRTLMRRYELPRELLCFELTETTAIANLHQAAELMHEIKALGCSVALDDFGTGMSSFAYLKHLPVDAIKIAGVFVKDMAQDPMDYAIVEAINRISHILGMRTVAEEVEDAATLDKVRELQIDFAQGYYIAEPEALLMSDGAALKKG